jgi:rare lipoprotein A
MKARMIRGAAAAGTLAILSQSALGFPSKAQDGLASFYNAGGLTAAHRSLPFGSRVQVTNLRTGKTIIVRINDRGPFVRGRIIDLSKRAAHAIGISSVGPVRVTLVSWGTRLRWRRR